MLTHTPRRFLVMLMMLTALLSFAGLQLASQPASADSLVTLQSCTPATSGSGVTCTLQLMVTVNPGGMWKATVNDSGATVSDCDGSGASATCTTSGNSATFTCSTGCSQNSKVTITVQGDAHPQDVYFTSLRAGTVTGATGPTNTVGAAVVSGPYGPTTGQVLPAQVLPQGGMCVGASYPSPYGCTSAYVSVPTITYGGYSGCYGGFYTYGCGYPASYNVTPPFYANCAGFFFIGGCSNFFYNNFNNCGNFFFNRGCGNNGCFNWNWWGCGNNNNGCVSIYWHCGNNGCGNGNWWNCGNNGNNGCWGGNWNCGNNGGNHWCGNQQGQQGAVTWSNHTC